KNKKVTVEKIENYIKKYGVPIYIKIDVEGYEYEVIQGLETAVPLISLEANLPEFKQESVNCITYLSNISKDKYVFNFTTNNSFILINFVPMNEAVKFITTTELRYLEIYAKLVK
ncbi:MAG: FkbM family methyltransferase, partial [Chitinophagales bacterium]|nr:FkbM family methyltransferase [Chitinophagales bacterium]